MFIGDSYKNNWAAAVDMGEQFRGKIFETKQMHKRLESLQRLIRQTGSRSKALAENLGELKVLS